MMSNENFWNQQHHAKIIQCLSVMTISDPEEKEEPIESSPAASHTKALPKNKQKILDELIALQQSWDKADEEALRNIPIYPFGDSEEDFQNRFKHINEMTLLIIKNRIEFLKRVFGFNSLYLDDQLFTAMGASMELMVLEGARNYDIKTDSITFIKNHPFTYDYYAGGRLEEFAQGMFPFCRDMAALKVTDVEYALLSAILIFSDRPNHDDRKGIETRRNFYVETLRLYTLINRPLGQNFFEWLHLSISELHSVSNKMVHLAQHHKYAENFDSLLKEVWHIRRPHLNVHCPHCSKCSSDSLVCNVV